MCYAWNLCCHLLASLILIMSQASVFAIQRTENVHSPLCRRSARYEEGNRKAPILGKRRSKAVYLPRLGLLIAVRPPLSSVIPQHATLLPVACYSRSIKQIEGTGIGWLCMSVENSLSVPVRRRRSNGGANVSPSS